MLDIKAKIYAEYLRQRSISLEDVVANAIERVAALESAKERALSRELATSLSEGRTKSTGNLERINRDLMKSRTSQSQLRSASERLRIRAPVRREGTCIVHGRVVDERGKGVSGWAVSAGNEHSQVLGRAQTGELGYFKLEIGGVDSLGLEANRGRSGRERFETRGSPKATQRFFLQVAKANGEIAHQDAQPTGVTDSGVVYREIHVDRS